MSGGPDGLGVSDPSPDSGQVIEMPFHRWLQSTTDTSQKTLGRSSLLPKSPLGDPEIGSSFSRAVLGPPWNTALKSAAILVSKWCHKGAQNDPKIEQK